MQNIATLEDLQVVRSKPSALVFLWVNWAIQARQSEVALKKFMEAWQRANPQHPLPVFRADVGDQEGEPWEMIRAWLKEESRDADHLTYSGCGALLWVNAGRILMDRVSLLDLEVAKFLAATRSVFGVR